MRRTLPTYYYLDHFNEFVRYLTQYNQHLLRPNDVAFIDTYLQQTQPVQCVLVRSLNRKAPVMSVTSLYYNEIADNEQAIATCHELGWLVPIDGHTYHQLLTVLTKPQLIALLQSRPNISFKQSNSKAELLSLAQCSVAFEHACPALLSDYVSRGVDQIIDYGLFLFFGHCHGKLNQFSMRDLGIMRTRKQIQAGARFDSLAQSQSAFVWSEALLLSKRAIRNDEALPQLPDVAVCGAVAEQSRDECLLIHGKACVKTDPEQAIALWTQSNHVDAFEKRIRTSYQLGNVALVEAELSQCIDDPANEAVLLFAEDFLSRKYHKKRTSVLTDWLRSSERLLTLDESHKNRVERACVEHFRQQGIEALRLENEPWKALFGLVFWPILFAPEAPQGNEFDTRPGYIIRNNLYEAQFDSVEVQLALLDNWRILLLQRVTEYYGNANGVFRWHKQLLKVLTWLCEHNNIDFIRAMLRAMAQNYALYSDGFPDIAVIEAGTCQFLEVKATGDVLRKNQLVTLSKMRDIGFSVDLLKVEWGLDPKQPFVIVDIETTGGRAAQHKITEIGAVKWVDGEIVDRWQTLLNPQRHIPYNITQLTGIDDAMVADAPIFADVADSFRAFCEGCIFVAHNVNFDYGFIKSEYDRLEQFFSLPKLCTVREMRKAYPGLASYSLANLTRHFEIKMTRHHRAMSDAVAAAELFAIIQQKRLDEQSDKAQMT